MSMVTRIRLFSSPCSTGFVVSGRSTSGPLPICGAITMKMISSTSTTSTSGVMLMAACILPGSPSCIDRPALDARHLGVPDLELRNLEQAVHQLRGGPVDLDVDVLELAGELVEGDDRRDRDEAAQRRRDQGLGDTARDRRHSAGPRGRDTAEGVDDADDGAEQTDERRSRADGGQDPETPL